MVNTTATLERVEHLILDAFDTGAVPTIVLDIDNTIADPRERSHRALEATGVSAFRSRSTYTRLPLYKGPSLERFMEPFSLSESVKTAVRACYAEEFLKGQFALYSREDALVPGVPETLRRWQSIAERRKTHLSIAYLTGRTDSQRELTIAWLRRWDLPSPENLYMHPENTMEKHEDSKLRHMRDSIIQGQKRLVAFFDDLQDNRTLLGKQYPRALMVEVCLPAYEPETDVPTEWAISSFRRIEATGAAAGASE